MTKRLPVVLMLFAFIGVTSAMAQVRINEVGVNGVDFDGASSWVELYNAGSTDANVADLVLCDFPAYPAINTLAVLGGGSTTIPAGGYLVLSWPALDNDAEVGLYVAGTSGAGFQESSNMLDYMQYGSAGHQRESVGVAAGVWTAGEFVPSADAGMSLQFVDNGEPGSGNWVMAEATPNGENLASAVDDVRINEVGVNGVDFDGASSWVELYNAGSEEVEVMDLILCDFPAYPAINTLAVLGGGSTTIPAGGYLVLSWPALDDDAEVGLYLAGTSGAGFGESSNMIDYMQYGSAGHQREEVGVALGVWTAGEFVPSADAGMSLQFIDNGTPGSGNWVMAAATPNDENQTSTNVEEVSEAPGAFALNANYPNPFNPETTISYDLERSGHVHLAVYDVFGREVMELVNGTQPAGSYATQWQGQDQQGSSAASGIYFYRLTLDGAISRTRVMTLLK